MNQLVEFHFREIFCQRWIPESTKDRHLLLMKDGLRDYKSHSGFNSLRFFSGRVMNAIGTFREKLRDSSHQRAR